MKYLTFALLILVLAFGVEANAQGERANNFNNPCPQFKIGIITPTKDIDFKMIIIEPPKGIDTGMVINVCPEQKQLASAPQIVLPLKETSEFFKAPPFTIKNKYYKP
jgi:hypothetical protein